MTEKRKLGFVKSTAMAACFGLAFSASAVAPQKAEAFQGFFGFSTEACYNNVISAHGGAWGNPMTFIADWFMLVQVIENVQFWSTTVCDESDAERWSDATIKAAWVVCVDNLANSGDQDRLRLHNANPNDPATSANIWPYKKWFSWNPLRNHMAADHILKMATNNRSAFTGTTHHPTRVLDEDELTAMVNRCNATQAQKDAIARQVPINVENDD